MKTSKRKESEASVFSPGAGIRHPGCDEAPVQVRPIGDPIVAENQPETRVKPRLRVDIEHVAEALGMRIREGTSWSGWVNVHCSIHGSKHGGDRHASAGIHPETQVFVCHVCDIQVDRVGLVMAAKRISYPDAVSWIKNLELIAFG